MEDDFVFKINDLFQIEGNHIVTGELENNIDVGCKIIIISEDMTARGEVRKIELFEDDIPKSVNEVHPGQPVALYIKIPEGFPIKKGMYLYKTYD